MSSLDSTEAALAPSVLGPLVDRLGYHFDDPARIGLALTHRSWCAEHPGTESNERLEFLGDAVLGVIVTDSLYRSFPELPEGQLAKVRAAVVSSVALAGVAEGLGLGEFILLGRGEDLSGGRDKQSILADAMEAVIGAVYLDGGLEVAANVVLGLLGSRIAEVAEAGPGAQDYKTRLQERVASLGLAPPVYELTEDGPDHDKRFFASVGIDGTEQGTGSGTSKKMAEQAAAEQAWAAMAREGGLTPPDNVIHDRHRNGGSATAEENNA